MAPLQASALSLPCPEMNTGNEHRNIDRWQSRKRKLALSSTGSWGVLSSFLLPLLWLRESCVLRLCSRAGSGRQ